MKTTLWFHSFFTFVSALMLIVPFPRLVSGRDGMLAGTFLVITLVDSCVLFALGATGPSWLVMMAARLPGLRGRTRELSRLALFLAAFFGSLLLVALYADGRVFALFGFHLNGFVWNLLSTPGGIESMNGDAASIAWFAGIAAGFVALQGASLMGAHWIASRVASLRLRPCLIVAAGFLLVLTTTSTRLAHGVSRVVGYSAVLDVARLVPFYRPFKVRGLAQALGWDVNGYEPRTESNGKWLGYPRKPIRRIGHDPMNLVVLVAESWRADTLDPQIMPATWAFSREGQTFSRHYSGGNGTRMGLFSLFYGLYGSSWFSFLDHRQEPLLMQIVRDDGYQLGLFTSARFSYPEFDKTLFAGVPSEQLHEERRGKTWQRDRKNVSSLIHFIDDRDKQKPFMGFVFFESPHARYEFPAESAIHTPYLEELNYATMDLERDMALIWNRYVNSTRHLDSQMQRVLEHLKSEGLLESTMVVITGDHGEEFMEHGRWGHNSEFDDPQTRVPLILWLPGERPSDTDRMTSHLDIVPTLLPRFGVSNPSEDYSQGHDLLGPFARDHVVVADWNRLAIVRNGSKLVFSLGTVGLLAGPSVLLGDEPADEAAAAAVLSASREVTFAVMKELGRFLRP